MVPPSRRAISNRADNILSAPCKARSSCCRVLRSSSLCTLCSKAVLNRRAACMGCNKSWLAAAIKRLFDILALSACSRASCCSVNASASCWVRSWTRASSMASFSRKAVMSAKVVTKPPPSIGLPRIWMTRPSLRIRSNSCALPTCIQCIRFRTCSSTEPGPHSPRSALYRIKSEIGQPT